MAKRRELARVVRNHSNSTLKIEQYNYVKLKADTVCLKNNNYLKSILYRIDTIPSNYFG